MNRNELGEKLKLATSIEEEADLRREYYNCPHDNKQGYLFNKERDKNKPFAGYERVDDIACTPCIHNKHDSELLRMAGSSIKEIK